MPGMRFRLRGGGSGRCWRAGMVLIGSRLMPRPSMALWRVRMRREGESSRVDDTTVPSRPRKTDARLTAPQIRPQRRNPLHIPANPVGVPTRDANGVGRAVGAARPDALALRRRRPNRAALLLHPDGPPHLVAVAVQRRPGAPAGLVRLCQFA